MKKNVIKNFLEIRREFHYLFENSLDYLFIYDLKGRIYDVNDIVLKNLGYSKEEILKKSILDFIVEDNYKKAQNFLNEIKTIGRPTKYITFKIEKKDGNFIYLEVSGILFKFQEENNDGILGIGHDITLLKQTKELLIDYKEKYHSLLEGLNQAEIGISFINKKYKILLQNEILKKIFGNIIGEYCYKEYRGLNNPCDNCPMIKAIKNNKIETAELIGKNEKIYKLISVPLPKPDGTINSAAILVLNITHKVKEKHKIKNRDKKFENLEYIINHSPAVMFLWRNAEGWPVDFVSDNVRQFGYQPEDFYSGKVAYADIIHSDDLERVNNEVSEYSKMKQEEFSQEYRILTYSNEIRWIDDRTWVRRDLKGIITYFQGIILDITEKKRAEQKLKESEEKFRKLFKGSPHFTLAWQKVNDDFILVDYNDIAEKATKGEIKKRIGQTAHFAYVQELNRPDLIENLNYCFENKLSYSKLIQRYVIFLDDVRDLKIKYSYVPPDLVCIHIKDITEKLKAEQKLKESEEQFRNIAEQSLLGISISQDNKIKYMNKKYEDIWGYSLEEIKKWQLEDMIRVIHPDDRNFVLEQFSKKQRGEREIIHQYQYRGFKKSGELIWVDNYSKPIQFKGKPADFITLIDITDKKEAEQKLKESEEQFRNIAEQSLLGICIGQDDKVVYVNKKFEEIWGYSHEEMMQWDIKDVTEAIHPEDRDFVIKQISKKQRGDQDIVIHYEYRGIKKSGDIIWIENYSRPIIYRGKTADLVTAIDITDKKVAEQKLKVSEEKYRYLFETSPNPIILMNTKGEFLEFNSRLDDVFGYSKKDLIGKIFSEIGVIHPDYLQRSMNLFKELVYRTGTIRDEILYIKKDGTLIWGLTQGTLIRRKDKHLIQLIIQDITERKEAERLIIQENEKLQELHETRKDIITRVSHELKTPLTSIYGVTNMLMGNLKNEMNDKILYLMKILHIGAKRLKKLVNNLLDVSILESKKIELKLKNKNIVKILRDCIREMEYLAQSRQIRLNMELPDSLLLKVDEFRFQQAINNIISNAIKNTPSRGDVFISLIEMDRFIDIQIKDTGVGITEKEMEKLFKKFGKIERYGMNLDVDIEGSGLGLYISKEIVELHGGEIYAESEGRNKGSIFIIRLYKKNI